MNDFVVTLNGRKRNIILSDNGSAIIDGKIVEIKFTEISDNTYLLKTGSRYYHFSGMKKNGEEITIFLNGNSYETTVRSTLQEKVNAIENKNLKQSHSSIIKAPMPGKIIKICKKIGDEVILGDSLIILDAMKMENNIHASSSGRITKIQIKEGEAVEKGTILLEIKQ